MSEAAVLEIKKSDRKYKKLGYVYLMCCPFHKEKTPSFSIHALQECYRCFSCGKNGKAIVKRFSFLLKKPIEIRTIKSPPKKGSISLSEIRKAVKYVLDKSK